MNEMEPVMGSVEVIVGDESRGIAVQAATVESVPVIVEAVYGVHSVTPVETVGGAVACWAAKDRIGADVRVVLWPEPSLPAPREEGGA